MRTTPIAGLPDVLVQIYGDLPTAYVEFLQNVERCLAADDSAWFLWVDDFVGSSDAAFAWNEFELQSLAAAKSDEKWRDEIKAFWDKHVPIANSVRSGMRYGVVSRRLAASRVRARV